MNNRLLYILLIVLVALPEAVMAKRNPKLAPSYAWTISEPLGQRYESTIDTLQLNYHLQAVPSMVSKAYATTGNLGAEGQNQIFFDRSATSDFFFEDALEAWLPSLKTQRYYNTRIPMTLMSYNTGGSKDNVQDRFRAEFSGNVNKSLQIGAALDYLYSKGYYNCQATKDFTWRFFGSYIGDRYEMQAFYNNYNFLNKENGGITDDRYITDPAEVQGGSTKVDYKTVPVNLTNAHAQIWGHEFYMNHRYKVGYYHVERDSTDSIVSKNYIPVTSFIWTMKYKTNKHMFLNSSAREDTTFFKNTYLRLGGSDDRTYYWRLTNTVGISMLEGFHRYAKFGLAAYATYEVRQYTQVTDTIDAGSLSTGKLTPMPEVAVPHIYTDNVAWVGGQLTKQKGSILTYNATAQFGVLGSVAGDISVSGDVSTKFKFRGDSLLITGYGYFKNEEVPYLLKNYISNHYVWQNSFGKTRRVRLGGILDVPFVGARINVGVENIQNYIYFGEDARPVQAGDNIQVFSATLSHRFTAGPFNWHNSLTYQTSSRESMLPLPKFSVYSNMYLKFAIARVLLVNFGVDCSYYTSYYAPDYNPATMAFYNQHEIKCGNFPFANVYADFKLKKTRFFIMMSNVTDGMIGKKNCFSMPHYPLNSRRFQLGVSIDFQN